MSYPDPSSRMSMSTSSSIASPFWSASTSSIPDRPVSIQEESVRNDRTIYHTSTGMALPTQENHPEGHAQTSYGPSQMVDMQGNLPAGGISLRSSASNSIVQNTSFFSGAHHLTFNNPIMVANDRPEVERKMLKLLKKNAMADGTYDSAARQYTVPQCHSNTRVSLRERLINWLLNMDREESLFWLYGPAGVGKSAIAQNVMEYCAQKGFPGAGLFLSRANKRDDPNRIIPSLAHQLALAYPAYRLRISNTLNADSTILEKRLALQFQHLISEPADALMIEASNVTPHPILLVLDGLDECNTYEAQCELIKIFVSFASTCKARRLPFVCLITSRPEWQIVSTFDALVPPSRIWQEELPMDTPEARLDVSMVLRDGFENIKSKHNDAFSVDIEWPARTDLQMIESAASGNMLFASLVVTFVDDDYPITQLELCLKSLQGKLTSDERNPFDPLTALYRELLLNIPPTLLRTALLVLYFQLFVSENSGPYDFYDGIPVQDMANFLFIGQAAFYGSLKRLRSVLSIPLPTNASRKGLVFCHATFADYVKVAVRAGHFKLHEVDILEEIQVACIKWHHILIGKDNREDISGIVPWAGDTTPEKIRHFLQLILFKLWHGLLHQGNIGKLQAELENFSFKDLPRHFINSYNKGNDLMRLAHDLVTNMTQSSASTCIVRTVPIWPTDYQLINKYVGLFGQWGMGVKPLDWDSLTSGMWDDVKLWFCSIQDTFNDNHASVISQQTNWCPTTTYFLLGHDQNAVLMIACPRAMDPHVYWKEVFEKIRASHSMDDPWPADLEQSLLYSYFYHNPDSLYNNVGNREPPKTQIRCNSLACNIVSFVVDLWCGNPYSRLKIVVDVLSNASDSAEIMRCLCHHILGDIPHGIRHVAQQVLAYLLIFNILGWDDMPLKDLKCLMCVDYATINTALQWLRPLVLSWPPNSSDPNIVYLSLRLPYLDLQGNYIDHFECWRMLGYTVLKGEKKTTVVESEGEFYRLPHTQTTPPTSRPYLRKIDLPTFEDTPNSQLCPSPANVPQAPKGVHRRKKTHARTSENVDL
ncbi:hypothetical protein D9756_010156 [Leucocoprinus leucothites]|uniref:Nephrocystin 3-like N-terminal domain-containing protein n=1 Tax=Leucocoprinus leucothites TaxID=201217 RepID=A0A8H5FT11_9AGAR|nr:hypothetical protein D9756_010156 [Leucoagaricus leucothites]